MSEKTFKASKGITVTISDEGYLTGTGGNEGTVLHATGGAEYGVQALREYFQHERDRQLGRVRWPEDPDYVIHRAEEHDDEDGRCVRVLHEPSAIAEKVWERWPASDSDDREVAARWYFEEGPGKPERPWEDAQPGEVWRITFAGEEQNAIAEKETSADDVWFGTHDNYVRATDPYITAGRKLVNADGTPADD